MDEQNPELHLAEEYLRDTGCNIFLTGKAGTGKTTFLHGVKERAGKRLIITAPTGVAAINAGGVTLHSFFQLPFGPFLPGNEDARRHRFTSSKINIIKSLDLLVIDEISMVRADLLDGVDSVLRRYRRNEQPFGGVQLLLIGDLHQLAPVVKEQEWQLLQPLYDSPYFFSSTALRRSELVTIELARIYRQADDHFIHLLNRVRTNRLDQATLQALNERYRPDADGQEIAGAITLCSHNHGAERLNTARLEALAGRSSRFQATVEGDFPEHAYPTAATLEVKIGAQVMFVRNDQSPEKRYFNGRIGRLAAVDGETLRVRCPGQNGGEDEIAVEPTSWTNIQYQLDQQSMELKENILGTFRQFPLKLAWAITIHKSQGLTFDRAIIDAQAAFAHGQVYVALSRCRSLEGIVLSAPLTTKAIRSDQAIDRFTAEREAPSPAKLAEAKRLYQQGLILDCFDFRQLATLLGRLVFLARSNPGLLQLGGGLPPAELQLQTETEICRVGENFRRQLAALFPPDALPATEPAVLARLAKASAYFTDKFTAGIEPALAEMVVESDNQDIRKKANALLKLLRQESAVRLAGVRSCADGFSAREYHRALAAAAVQATTTARTAAAARTALYSEADVGHPELFQSLKEWRSQTAREENIAPFQVLHQKTLVQIAIHLPESDSELKKIRGIGNRLAERYGGPLLAMVREYRQRHGIDEVVLPAAGATES